MNCFPFPHTRVHPGWQWGLCCWIISLVLKQLLFFLLCFFSLVIVLFVLPRITASDYAFVIFKPFKTISVRYITSVFSSRVIVLSNNHRNDNLSLQILSILLRPFVFISPKQFKLILLSNRSNLLILSVPDEGYSRHASSTLILISTFVFIVVKTFVQNVSRSTNVYWPYTTDTG
jgi:hypothetical protein